MSEAAASLQAETDGGDANESASPPAKRAKTDSLGVVEVTGDRWFRWSVNNRLSRDDDRLLKKIEFYIPSPNNFIKQEKV